MGLANEIAFATDYAYPNKFVGCLVGIVRSSKQGCDSRTRGNHARGLKNSLHAVFTRYLCGNHVRCINGNMLKYTVNTGVRCSFWWWGVVVSSSFVCGALAFLFILSFSLRALSSRLVRAPSAAVFIAMDHGCAHTDKCEMLLQLLGDGRLFFWIA